MRSQETDMPYTATLQATGFPPYEVEVEAEYRFSLALKDKREVAITVYCCGRAYHYLLEYRTGWDDELPFAIGTGPFIGEERLAEAVRATAKNILPPGAGFPGTPDYAGRQSKLKGQLEAAALHCLTQVLATLAKEQL
jgi:hypothetical protein